MDMASQHQPATPGIARQLLKRCNEILDSLVTPNLPQAKIGNCPFGHISRQVGDSKPFFELFLPPRIAKQMFKVNFVIVLIGCALLLIRLAV